MKLASCSWPTDCGVACAGQRHVDRAVGGDGHALRVGRDGDAGLQHVAVAGDDLAGGVELERAVAGVAGAAVGQLDLEEAVALDRDVEVVAGLLQVALAEVARRRRHARAQADLQPGRQLRLVAAGRAGLAQVLVHQVLEDHAAALVAVGADVGQVVGDGVQLELLAFHAGLGDPQRTIHAPVLPTVAGQCRANRARQPSEKHRLRGVSYTPRSPAGRRRPSPGRRASAAAAPRGETPAGSGRGRCARQVRTAAAGPARPRRTSAAMSGVTVPAGDIGRPAWRSARPG